MATQVRVQVPSSVASWSTRPAPFSTRKQGTRVKFSVDNTVAERVGVREYFGGAVVYTEFRPIATWTCVADYNTGHHYSVVLWTGEWMCPLLPVMPEAVHRSLHYHVQSV